MRQYRIVDASYFRDVVLVIGSGDELNTFSKRKDPEGDYTERFPDGRYATFKNDATHYILISTRQRGIWLRAVLAHEILHLTFAVLMDAGVGLCEASEEAYTYYFQGMFAQCLKKLPRN